MKAYEHITDAQSELIARQHMFFVATAPLAEDGHVNLSPKGLDSFVVLGPDRVAYLDLGGSGIETHAHLRENGRICLMFCAFDGEPLIVRLYGRGSAHAWGTPRFDELRPEFPAITVPVRGVIEVAIDRTQDSCGWAVPLYAFEGHRDRLLDHNAKRDQETFFERRLATNGQSIDGLPGLERP